MTVLPITTVINVNVTEEPAGIGVRNVNAVGLLTTESPNNSNPFGIYLSYAQVATDYGTSSVTAQMASNVFAQNPNILAGSGYLVIMPLLASVSATPGYFTTASIVANVANFAAVTNGDLTVTLDGVATNLSNLNFAFTTDLADIAAVLNAALPNATVTANSTEIIFTNNKVGTAATVALSTYAGGGTDLTGTTLLHSASGTATVGVNSTGETIAAAVTRTSALVSYTGLMSNLNLEDTAIETAATALQAQQIIFFQHGASTADIAGIATTVSSAGQSHTRILVYTGTQASANLMKSAYVGRFFSVDFTGSNTDLTMNLKQLANVTPDPYITTTLQIAANTAGANIYPSVAGYPCVLSAEGNTYDDIIYRNLALQFALQTNAFNYLAQTTTKVPQTESGMYGFKNSLAQVMQQFVINGCFAPGGWPSPDTFGNQQLFLNNITNYGFYIYSQPIAQQSSAARAARQAPLTQIAALGSGAIQTAAINVIVAF